METAVYTVPVTVPGKAVKETARGLENRIYEQNKARGPVANRQNPVGENNGRRKDYLKAADEHLAANPCT